MQLRATVRNECEINKHGSGFGLFVGFVDSKRNMERHQRGHAELAGSSSSLHCNYESTDSNHWFAVDTEETHKHDDYETRPEVKGSFC